MKKLVSILLAAVMVISLAACGGEPKETTPAATIPDQTQGTLAPVDNTKTYKESVTIAYWFDLDTADPYGSTTAAQQFYTNFTFDNVVFNDPDTGELVPQLAESWKDVNGDGLIWDFALRKNVKFHNGNPLKAEDVKFTWEYTASGAGNVVKSNANSSYVDEIEVIDDNTVRFKLQTAMFDWPSYMETKIYNKAAFDTLPAEEAAVIGTGPYYYDKSKHTSGVQFTAERFDDYWAGIEEYPTKSIIFKVLLDEDTRVAALQAGSVDFIFNVNAASYNTLSNDKNLQMFTRKGANSYYMGFNHRKEAMQDPNVRKALAMGINRTDIKDISFNNGIGGVENFNFCVPSGAGYSADAKAPEYNVEEAKKLLADAGYADLKLVLGHTATTKAIAEVVQDCLSDIGVTVELRQVDASNWTAFKKADEYDLFTDYAAYQGALLYNFHRFFDPTGSANMFGYNNEEYVKLENEVLTAGSYEKMVAKFADLQKFVAENLPLVPLAVGNQIAAGRLNVEGVTLAPGTNYMNFSHIRIEE